MVKWLILVKIQIWPNLHPLSRPIRLLDFEIKISREPMVWFFWFSCTESHFRDLQVCTKVHPRNNWNSNLAWWDVDTSDKVHPRNNWKLEFGPDDHSYSIVVLVINLTDPLGQTKNVRMKVSVDVDTEWVRDRWDRPTLRVGHVSAHMVTWCSN